MAILDIRVPQMGEGLREVLIHRLLKKPGDFVKRDEIIYVMESDKAIVEVESSHQGILKEWLVEEARVLSVGATIARIESETGVADDDSFVQDATASKTTGPQATQATKLPAGRVVDSAQRQGQVFVPPRTRAYCKSLAIPEDEILNIPATTGTLMPADVDRYQAQRPGASARTQACPVTTVAAGFRDRPLPAQQRVLNFRLMRSAQLVVPGTVKRQLDWQKLKQAVKALRRANPGVRASDFETFAYAVAQATTDHPEFRSVLLKDDVIREFDHLELGLAVQQPNGDLVMAVVPEADRLDFPSFVALTQDRVRQALNGEDQINERVPLHINYVARLKVTDGIPVLIAPAVAVVFLCAPTGTPLDRKANLGVTFDHRLINGACAARFLASIIEQINNLAAEVESIA
jgi:pyruvate dehydrogenase E2 component (dihydrolipoamide acetyltransferase)